jgi:hypothetical protein
MSTNPADYAYLELPAGPMTSRYTKAVVAILAAVLVVFGAAITDDVVTTLEVVNVAIALVTAVGVYLVPNLPAGPGAYLKAAVAFLGAGLAALVTVLGSGGLADVHPSAWITVFLAALGGVGVYVLPNADDLALAA